MSRYPSSVKRTIVYRFSYQIELSGICAAEVFLNLLCRFRQVLLYELGNFTIEGVLRSRNTFKMQMNKRQNQREIEGRSRWDSRGALRAVNTCWVLVWRSKAGRRRRPSAGRPRPPPSLCRSVPLTGHVSVTGSGER